MQNGSVRIWLERTDRIRDEGNGSVFEELKRGNSNQNKARKDMTIKQDDSGRTDCSKEVRQIGETRWVSAPNVGTRCRRKRGIL